MNRNYPIHPIGKKSRLIIQAQELDLREVGLKKLRLEVILEPLGLTVCRVEGAVQHPQGQREDVQEHGFVPCTDRPKLQTQLFVCL